MGLSTHSQALPAAKPLTGSLPHLSLCLLCRGRSLLCSGLGVQNALLQPGLLLLRLLLHLGPKGRHLLLHLQGGKYSCMIFLSVRQVQAACAPGNLAGRAST